MSSGTGTRWVTFDCYGTLVDWQAGLSAIATRLAGRLGADIARAYHTHEPTIVREPPHRSYKDVIVSAMTRAAADCGVRLSAADAQEALHAWTLMRPFEDTEPMLSALRARGWRLAALTNCDDDLFAVTHRSFDRPFDLHVTAERVRVYKPAPWHFRAFERLTCAERGAWVHVACSWYHDIEPARALGIPRVWLDRDRTGEDAAAASAHVYAAHEVPEAIEQLVAAC